ncbi:hypothetical protein [Methanobacterium paludis]|uniref:Uncharacterized protein n=1 Tax=Methanobacterium paludis (strain DSM 25820 / JCM 18151 / SWAN1) TaxID=868131 RepID=F6D748_METPW|nr:hypothetical protein [Methanobacterium paludis]AEG19007.1 hypothetical protein MSWAN_1998 [Methanobacterium paludis]
MNKTTKILIFGFLLWLVPFLVSVVIYPLKTSENPLFESIMPVVITLTVVLISIKYFTNLSTDFLREGILTGMVWFLINIILDLSLFMWGPMQMSFENYMMDIGLTYLIIPTVTIGFGYIIQNH